MPARDLIAPVDAEQEQRPLLRRRGERRQQLEGRRIGPLEVVQEDDGRAGAAEGLEGAPDGLEERFAVGCLRAGPKLREKHGELRRQRAHLGEPAGRATQE